MVRRGHLDLPIIAVAKSGWTLDQLRPRAEESVERHGVVDRGALDGLMRSLTYVDGDYGDASTFDRLRLALGATSRPAHYLVVPPSVFELVVDQLGRAACARDGRLIVETPFGRGLGTAKALNRTVHEIFYRR